MAIRQIAYKDRDEWLRLRRNYIGGSDAGAVVGLNPYRSAFALWAEKTGQTPGFEGNITTEVGSYLEPLVAELFTRETGKKVRRKNRILVSDEYPFACADVDRVIVGEDALLECKTTTSVPVMRQLRRSGDEFPDIYYAQCVHYLAITGCARIYLAAMVNNRELMIFTLERDEGEIAALMEAERRFWEEHVVPLDPPPVDGETSTTEALTAMIGNSDDEREVDLTPLAEELRHYETLSGLKEDTEAAMEAIKNRLREYMGDATRGTCDRFSVSWKTQQRKTFDKKALAQDHPEICLDRYTKVSESRPMTIRIKAEA